MQDGVVHPSALFHVPILGCNTTITEMMALGHADGPDTIMIESYEWDMFHPLKEDVSYKATGRITEASRCVGGIKNVYDRIQFLFELVDPEGELIARSIITWCYIRRRAAEKVMMGMMAFTIWMKKFFPAKIRNGLESVLLKLTMDGIQQMFPRRPKGE
jgi:aspartate oxidase